VTRRTTPGTVTSDQLAELGAMFRAAGLTSTYQRRDFMCRVLGDAAPSVFDDWLVLSHRQAGDLLEALRERTRVPG
jgi:hypothetical protein